MSVKWFDIQIVNGDRVNRGLYPAEQVRFSLYKNEPNPKATLTIQAQVTVKSGTSYIDLISPCGPVKRLESAYEELIKFVTDEHECVSLYLVTTDGNVTLTISNFKHRISIPLY